MSDIEEDEVVQEIDVFNCKSFLKQLHLLQYPLQKSGSYGKDIEDQNKEIQARYQLRTSKLELDIPLDTGSSAYDKCKADQIAAISAKEGANKTTMNAQTLTSVNASGRRESSYAMGLLINGQLHMNPLGRVYQMRPSFSNLNAEKKKGTANQEGGDSSQDESESEAAAQSIRVRFADGKQRKQKGPKPSVEDERWVNLRYAAQHDGRSLLHAKNLIFKDKDMCDVSDELEFFDEKEKLLRILVPEAEEELNFDAKSKKLSGSSQSELKKLPLVEQIKTVLEKSHIIRLGQLLQHLSLNWEENKVKEVLAALEKVAVLVEGCWVIKSEILYNKGASSQTSTELFCCARDLVLFKCSRGSPVTRKEVIEALKVPDDLLEEILNQLTKFAKTQRGWIFRMDTDNDFITKYPETVSHQALLWNSKWMDIQQFISNCARKSEFSQPSKQRRRRNSSRTFSSGENDMEESTAAKKRQNVPVASPGNRGTLGSKKQPKQDLQNGAENSDSSLVEAEFKKFLYEKLSTKHVLTTSEIKKLLLLKISETKKEESVLKNGISVESMKKCAVEIGAGSLFSNKTNEAIFLFSGSGSWPEAREFLVQFLMERNGFRFNTFKKACATQVTDMPADEDLRKLLLEYCILKAGIYSLSGT